VLYVFARKETAGTTWLAVGAPFAGPPLGWIKAELTVAWSQQLLLAFTNPAYRLRNLFFTEREGAIRFLEDENVVANAKRALDEADAGGDPGAGAIVSVEPKAFADINESFYILPILESEEYLLGGVFPGNLVKVASLPLDQPVVDPKAEALAQFNAAIVFVIDTTISMEPYIERTKEAIRRFTQEIAGSPLGERVSFGIVAFRGNTDVAPAVEYVSRVILEPSWPPKPGQLEVALGELEAATASTQGFIEDGMAGMQTALELPQWQEFGGRFVIYVSDTAAIDSANPLATTGKNPAEINALAREKQIATLVLLLKTAAGSAYHSLAEQQYKALAAWEGLDPLYFPIPEGDVGAFGEAVDQATHQVIAIVEQSIQGQLVEPPATPEAPTVAGSTRLVGRAMQLAWLGRSTGATAPELFEAWAYDRALDDPNRQSFEVRVLLNRNQINDLTLRLDALLTAAGSSQTGSRDFFQQLRSTMAQFVTDPQRLANADRIGDFLSEYLAALPYKSQVLTIDQATWTSLGPAAQDEILSGIRSKLAAYKLIYEDVGRWTALWEGAPAAELVYPVPLSLLP
jgi:serine/threonine-protein kinase PpkA